MYNVPEHQPWNIAHLLSGRRIKPVSRQNGVRAYMPQSMVQADEVPSLSYSTYLGKLPGKIEGW
jgi:hypothetical protein